MSILDLPYAGTDPLVRGDARDPAGDRRRGWCHYAKAFRASRWDLWQALLAQARLITLIDIETDPALDLLLEAPWFAPLAADAPIPRYLLIMDEPGQFRAIAAPDRPMGG